MKIHNESLLPTVFHLPVSSQPLSRNTISVYKISFYIYINNYPLFSSCIKGSTIYMLLCIPFFIIYILVIFPDLVHRYQPYSVTNIPLCRETIIYLPSPSDICSILFQSFTITNNAITSNFIHVIHMCTSISAEIIPRNGITGPKDMCLSMSDRPCKIVLCEDSYILIHSNDVSDKLFPQALTRYCIKLQIFMFITH